jgi:hypothetical protein
MGSSSAAGDGEIISAVYAHSVSLIRSVVRPVFGEREMVT